MKIALALAFVLIFSLIPSAPAAADSDGTWSWTYRDINGVLWICYGNLHPTPNVNCHPVTTGPEMPE